MVGDREDEELIYELRQYWIDDDYFDKWYEWLDTKACPLLQGDFGFRVVGFWKVDESDGELDEDHPNIAWIVAWKSREECDKGWDDVVASDGWTNITEGVIDLDVAHRRPLVRHFLSGIDRSPLN